MTQPSPATLSYAELSTASSGPAVSITLVLEGEQPMRLSSRLVLDEQTSLLICRGSERRVQRNAGREREVVLEIADPWMSSSQARVAFRPNHGWTAVDLGSKNGTSLNGQRISSAALEDGDVIEVGRTLLVFRATGWIDERLDVHEQDLLGMPPLRTLSPPFARALTAVTELARTQIPMLVTGETGTGKELVARAIHALSERPGELVAVNCGAIAGNLVESELFGHRRGAFSGATHDHVGLVRASDGGTLFLDEIGDLPLASQAALLRVVQEHEVVPVGETSPRKVDLRVVAATNRDLDKQVAAGAFRQDLLARLAGARVAIPALRARREDIGMLVRHFLRAELSDDATGVRFTQRAARALLEYDWPLNVRELAQAIAPAVVRAGQGAAIEPRDATRGGPLLIDLHHLPQAVIDAAALWEAPADPAAAGNAQSGRRAQVVALLREHAGNVSSVARELKTTRAQIHRWARRYGIDLRAFRSD